MNILRHGVTTVDRMNLRLDAIGADETSLVISLGHPTEIGPNPEPGRAGAGEPGAGRDGDAQSERGTVDEDSHEAPRGRLVERAAQRLSAGGRSAGGAVGDDPRAPEGGARMSGRVLATERGYRVEVSYDARAVEGIKGIQIGRAHV